MIGHGRVPAHRVRTLNPGVLPRGPGGYVLYWMTSARRMRWSHALDRAVDWCIELQRPLVIFEAIRIGYRWASTRFHGFVLDGMAEKTGVALAPSVTYFPYVEPRAGAGSGLVEALAADACVVVGDDFPCFFLPRMHKAVAPRLPVLFEVVDGNGILPMRVAERTYSAAYHFRRFLQSELPDHLMDAPRTDPLEEVPLVQPAELPERVTERWPRAVPEQLGDPAFLTSLPLDGSVAPVELRGGAQEGRRRLDAFLDDRLPRYAEERNHPDLDAVSGLSPYLHWGHLAAHEVFDAVAGREGWTPLRLGTDTSGKRKGWWGLSESAEAFLDQLVTWRELGFNFSHREADYDRYESLPAWARQTLEDHSLDPRPWAYDLAAFEGAETHDPLWNAAQRQLRDTGVVHNYLRMLWGKKILEWSQDPRSALRIMTELNNRYALDGRDPNSTSGIFWTLGRYDRGWPERPVFGKVRSMSSDRTRAKVRLTRYMERYA